MHVCEVFSQNVFSYHRMWCGCAIECVLLPQNVVRVQAKKDLTMKEFAPAHPMQGYSSLFFFVYFGFSFLVCCGVYWVLVSLGVGFRLV